MSKPEDVTDEAWEAADAIGAAIHGRHERGWVIWPLVSHSGPPPRLIVARAIMAAEKRGEEREREACLSACLTELAQAKENGCTQEAMGAHWCAVAIRARSA